jgi:hypothetical protein
MATPFSMLTGASAKLHALSLSWFKQSGKPPDPRGRGGIPGKGRMCGKAAMKDELGGGNIRGEIEPVSNPRRYGRFHPSAISGKVSAHKDPLPCTTLPASEHRFNFPSPTK